jgi:hypothetical protein
VRVVRGAPKNNSRADFYLPNFYTKMNIGRIFGTTFFSVLAALILYDAFVKSAVSGVLKYDNTFDPLGENREGDYFVQDGKVYRVTKNKAA